MPERIPNNANDYHQLKHGHKHTISIACNGVVLNAILYLPDRPTALIIFSHGSGSSRLSPRNNYVAEYLYKKNIAALLADLLTPEEDALIENRFNISLLTGRLWQLTHWAMEHPQLKGLPVGYFGASTGAASAINVAASFGDNIKAVVSRGGRPDLASEKALQLLRAPMLLIIGSLDEEVIDLNRKAFQIMKCTKHMEIIEGASHLFEENNKLHIVSEMAGAWFEKYLVEQFTVMQ